MSEAIIDACCLINVCAVADHQQWLAKLGFQWYLPSAVEAEALCLYETDAEGNRIAQPIALQSLVDEGILERCSTLSDNEIGRYVELAVQLDDGEAMALAIASCRHWRLATDDRKALRLAAELEVSVVTTLDIMQRWVEAIDPPEAQICAALRDIYDYARFMPSRRAPLYEWWMRFL